MDDVPPALALPSVTLSILRWWMTRFRFMRRLHYDVEPRRQWPSGRKIAVDQPLEPGRALARWGDPGWGDMVRDGKYGRRSFDDRLVTAMVGMIREWRPESAPQWLTFVPSRRHPELVPDFAERLGRALGIPVLPLVAQRRGHGPQREMENSAQQYANVHDVFAVDGTPPATPGFVLDDVVDSRWTVTTIGASLRAAGSGPIYPIALALAATS